MKKPQENVITVNTGDVSYAIKNEYGDTIGKIRFNPADPDILRRYTKVKENLRELDVPEEMEPDDFFKVTDFLKEQFNFLLNRNVSEELFGTCNPLTLTGDGSYYFANVMDAILTITSEVIDKRQAESEKRVNAAVAELTANE